MKVLILWADSHSANIGVRVLAEGLAQLALDAWGDDTEVDFQDFGPAGSLPGFGGRSIARDLGRRNGPIKTRLSEYDVILDSGAGDSFADIYGFKRLMIMMYTQRIAIRRGQPLIMGPQTIGPFSSGVSRTLASWILRKATLVFARDSRSLELAQTLGARPTLTTDVVFALPQPDVRKSRDIILNVSGLLWNGHGEIAADRYRSDVRDLITRLRANGRRVSLLAHVIDNRTLDNDVPPIEALAEEFDFVEKLVPSGVTEARALIASSTVVIGARMHACLNALSVGVPAIPWAYSRKFAPLMNDLGWKHVLDVQAYDLVAETLRILSLPRLAEDAQGLSEIAGATLASTSNQLRSWKTSLTRSPGGRGEISYQSTIKRVVPAPLLRVLKRARASVELRAATRYDQRRYLRFSSSVDALSSRQNLASKITESYHNLEKGLALPNPRPGFGIAVVAQTIVLTRTYASRYGEDHVTAAAAAALNAYVEFNRTAGLNNAQTPHYQDIRTLLTDVQESENGGGTRIATRAALEAAVAGVDESFFLSRSSIRQFSSDPISDEDIQSAVRVAQKSPAVCNRQFGRVYTIEGAARIATALKIQGGARGFAETVPALAVITTTVRAFWAAGERMQAWTDGGMFAMSFLLGLHARGLGAVSLNWSKTAHVDRTFHAEFDIPEDEVIVMLVAYGHVKEEYRVAASPRLPVSDALHRR